MDGFWTLLESVDGRVLRRMVIGMVCFVPTLMEVLALILLSGMIAEGQGDWIKVILCCSSVIVQGGIFLHVHFDIKFSSSENQRVRGEEDQKVFPMRYWGNGTYVIGSMTLMRKSQSTLFQCKVHAWIYLYFMALLTTTIQVTMHRIHQPLLLSGPFLVATGAFLVLSVADEGEDDFFLSILRNVLRRSLRDVMLEVGDYVAEDEMLRLAMLRWIVDYWASEAKSSKQSVKSNMNSLNTKKDDEITVTSIHEIGTSVSADVVQRRDALSLPQNTSSVSTHNTSSNNRNVERVDKLEWSRLYPMLNMTTDHMFHEVNNDTQDEENTSVKALKQMLSCLNCHERAKPAIESYKRAIHELSPPRSVAIYVGIAHRCPAIMSCLIMYLLQSTKANQCTIMLLPLILFEMMRLSEWIYVCNLIRESPTIYNERLLEDDKKIEHNWVISLFPNEVSAMEILLCKDDYESHKSCTAMHVWLNVCQSVKALESGLTAIKCVQTAQVASDLAFNIVSLTKIVKDVSHEGIVGGAGLIFLDLFHFHLGEWVSMHRQNSRGTGEKRETFVKAALDIVDNSQRLTKHVNELSEDSNVRKVLFSFVTFVMNSIRGGSRSNQEADRENTSDEARTKDLVNTSMKSKESILIDLDYDTCHQDGSLREDDDDDDVSWTTIRKPKSIVDENRHIRNDNVTDRVTEANERYAGDNLKWIGAVGAILGTIVGGIALASNKRDTTESRYENSRKNARQSVIIEQLDKDES
jgi:hypothetical protein